MATVATGHGPLVRPETQQRPIEETLAEALATMRSGSLRVRKADHESALAMAAEYQQRAASYREQVAYEERREAEHLKKAEELEAIVAKMTAELEEKEGSTKAIAQQQLAQIVKHADFASIEHDIVHNVVRIRTKVLFCDVRTEAGEDKHKRRNIGAYEIVLGLRHRDVYVINKLFTSHWSVNGDRPCLGEWNEEFNRLMNKGELYRLFELFMQYLRMSDDDAAAYMPSHEWVARKRDTIGADTVLKIGDRVCYASSLMVSSDNEIELKGSVGTVTAVYGVPGTPEYRADAEFICHEYCEYYDDEDQRVHIRVVPGDCVKITQEQYNEGVAGTTYTVRVRSTGRIAALDKMPNGSTLEDAQAIIAGCGPAKITISA